MDRYEQVCAKLKEKNIVINPPLSLEDVEFFERQHNIILPNSYRNFLLKVADGGIIIDGFPLLQLSKLVINDTIHKDFPLTDYWIWEEEYEDNSKRETMQYGNLEMIDIGDCQTWNLIISGLCAGEMWFFTDVGVQPACPRRDFLGWFEYWLDGGDDYFADFVY